jgi:S1-C subfamily serine protease
MNKPSNLIIWLVSAVVIIGFLAGVVGELWVNSFLLPDPYLNFKNFSDLSRRIDELVNGGQRSGMSDRDLLINENIKKARAALVSVYRYKNFSSNLNVSLLPSDLVGQAATITNDGWLLTSAEVAQFEKNVFWVETIDRKIYKAKVASINKSIGLAFLKIETKDLAVVEFSAENNLVNGQAVVAFGSDHEVINSSIKSLNFAELSDGQDFIHSSEVFYKFIIIQNQLEKKYFGAPIITLDGKMLGLYAGPNGLVIPVDHFVSVMKATIKEEKWQRPYLGIKFYDLSELLNDKNVDNRGIKIVSIKADSPAKGLLLPDDIIMKVEGDELNGNNNLPELLAQYPVNETIKFLVKRGVEEKTIDVKLVGISN